MTTPLFDMVKVAVSGTPGTGTITLGSAAAGFQTFAQAGAADGDTVSYSVIDVGNVWEVGHGVYHSAGPTVARGPLFSSSGGAAVSLASTAQLWCTVLAEDVLPKVNTFNTRSGAVTLTGADVAALDLSGLPTSDPGGGKVWINGGGSASGPLWIGAT